LTLRENSGGKEEDYDNATEDSDAEHHSVTSGPVADGR